MSKLTREEFDIIRERRSQDDMATLIAYVEEQFGIAAPRPEPSTSDAPPHPGSEPQTVVTVASVDATKSAAAKKPPVKK